MQSYFCPSFLSLFEHINIIVALNVTWCYFKAGNIYFDVILRLFSVRKLIERKYLISFSKQKKINKKKHSNITNEENSNRHWQIPFEKLNCYNFQLPFHRFYPGDLFNYNLSILINKFLRANIE